MVEAPSQRETDDICGRLTDVVKTILGPQLAAEPTPH
jgi:hypothetical protein